MPGKGNVTFQYGQEARAIQEKMGGQVVLGADQMGRMHFAMAFPDWTAWAKFNEKLQANPDWQAFITKVNQAPSAVLQDNYMLDQPSGGEVGSVYQVFIWQPDPGRGQDLLKRGMTAKAIHEKAGAKVGINFDQVGRMHYVMSFENWEAWGKFNDTPNEEFAKFVASFNEDPAAKLIKIYTANRL